MASPVPRIAQRCIVVVVVVVVVDIDIASGPGGAVATAQSPPISNQAVEDRRDLLPREANGIRGGDRNVIMRGRAGLRPPPMRDGRRVHGDGGGTDHVHGRIGHDRTAEGDIGRSREA
jgi:hypothetical protein